MPRRNRDEERRAVRRAQQYAGSKGRRANPRLFRTLGKKFGAFGEFIGMVADVLAGGARITEDDVEDAVRILGDAGWQVRGPGRHTPPPIAEIAPPPIQRGVPAVPTVRPPSSPAGPAARQDQWRPTDIEVLPTRIGGRYPHGQMPGGLEGVGPLILTPRSSNVYGFWYDEIKPGFGVLYVQFRAEGPTVETRRGTSVCSGNEYTYGARANIPGPTYSYGSAHDPVPYSLYARMSGAASAGKFVWTDLRVCGTVHAHQWPYTLTNVPTGQSVPRRATRRGLRVRTVPTVGTGARGGRRSTMPELLYDQPSNVPAIARPGRRSR